MYVHYIAVLADDTRLEALDKNWQAAVTGLEEARLSPREGAPSWLQDHPQVKADWGTRLYEVSASDLNRLTGRSMPEGKRYLAAWVECY